MEEFYRLITNIKCNYWRACHSTDYFSYKLACSISQVIVFNTSLPHNFLQLKTTDRVSLITDKESSKIEYLGDFLLVCLASSVSCSAAPATFSLCITTVWMLCQFPCRFYRGFQRISNEESLNYSRIVTNDKYRTIRFLSGFCKQ